MKQYQYILFDLDGTLTDPEEGIINCVIYALEDVGIRVKDRKSLQCFIGPPLVNSFQEFYGMSQEEAKISTAKYRERYSQIGLFENRAYSGITAVLERLKKAGKTLAIATSKPEVYAVPIAEKYGLAPYLANICGSELDGSRDEKWDVIEEVLKRLSITDRSLVLMVGDRKNDVIGAKKCGIDCLGVYYGYAEPGELERAGADYVVDTVEEMGEFIAKH